MANLLTPKRVISRLSARDVEHVITELTALAAEDAALDPEAARDAVLACGEASVFGFGRGVAIPHAAIPGLPEPVGVFARLKPPQDFAAADDIPADLAFLLLSPDGDNPTHLRALACVARRLRDRAVGARLRSAKDAEALFIVLTSDAWREPEGVPAGDSSSPSQSGDLTNGMMCSSIDA